MQSPRAARLPSASARSTSPNSFTTSCCSSACDRPDSRACDAHTSLNRPAPRRGKKKSPPAQAFAPLTGSFGKCGQRWFETLPLGPDMRMLRHVHRSRSQSELAACDPPARELPRRRQGCVSAHCAICSTGPPPTSKACVACSKTARSSPSSMMPSPSSAACRTAMSPRRSASRATSASIVYLALQTIAVAT